MIVYKITNLVNSKCYIGQTRNSLSERWRGHRKTKAQKYPLGKAIKKYGAQNFKIEIIGHANSLEQLDSLEVEFIAKYDSLVPNGYNLESGGKSCKKYSEQALHNISRAQKARFKTKPHPRAGCVGKLNPRSKPVLCITTGEVFESARQAALALGVLRSHVNTIAKGGGKEFRRSTKGYTFVYVDLIDKRSG